MMETFLYRTLLENSVGIQQGCHFSSFKWDFSKCKYGTFLYRAGDITGVHYFPTEIEDLIEKTEEIKLLL